MNPDISLTPAPGTVPRRTFLRRALGAGIALSGLATLTCGYGLWEASRIKLRRSDITLPNLPRAFAGKTIAVLGDFHRGPFVGAGFIRQAASLANSLAPDIIALVGDFVNKGTHTGEHLASCLDALRDLRAPLGIFAVPGNHDMQNDGQVYRSVVRDYPLTDLTNRAVRVSAHGESMWLAGVDDLWWGQPDLAAALREVPAGAALVLLSHNPDFAEESPDSRVGLVLSGHMHGGQIYLPALGLNYQPSRYGSKYRRGLVQGPASQVFITCGVGTAGVPLRINCPPEINLLSLHCL